jgi:hypothetical protein
LKEINNHLYNGSSSPKYIKTKESKGFVGAKKHDGRSSTAMGY